MPPKAVSQQHIPTNHWYWLNYIHKAKASQYKIMVIISKEQNIFYHLYIYLTSKYFSKYLVDKVLLVETISQYRKRKY